MTHVKKLEPELAAELPETYTLLASANLVVHDSVVRITLHGSRGISGNPRPDSDIDLALEVSAKSLSNAADPAQLLDAVLRTTLDNWQSHVEADLAAVFDKTGCGLRCLDVRVFDPDLCPVTVGCMGLYKIQRGFNGFVLDSMVDCRKMYPLMVIWRKPKPRSINERMNS